MNDDVTILLVQKERDVSNDFRASHLESCQFQMKEGRQWDIDR